MYPSKVIFEQTRELNAENAGGLMESSFMEVYSPKHTLEELVAELESKLQTIINNDPKKYLSEESFYGIQPKGVILRIDDLQGQNLQAVTQSKGKCLTFIARIEYEPVHLVGYLDNKYMIANTDVNLWSDYAEIIYIPDEVGITIRKIQFIE